jgi:hypothetical protein
VGGADNPTAHSNSSYGSMTAGALSSLLIYDFYLSVNPKTDAAVTKGLEWLAKNYDIVKNPKKKGFGSLYYLYALERVGSLMESEQIGNYTWYADGARFLMDSRKSAGVWHAGDTLPREAQVDTCFAVLFLSRSTPPLRKVAAPPSPSGDPAAVRPPPGKGSASVVDIVAPGWRLMNVPKNAPGLLGDARGKSNVLVTSPPNLNTPPTLRREVALPAGGKPKLRLVVGHHETNRWTLVVKADDKEIQKVAVGAASSKDGWVQVDVDLSAYAGKAPLLELVAQPSGEGTEVAYWAEVALVER